MDDKHTPSSLENMENITNAESLNKMDSLAEEAAESNINHLRQIVHDIDTGKAKLTEHELIEAD